MPAHVLAGLVHARIVLLIAGFAWLAGWDPPVLVRLALLAAALTALGLNAYVDEQRLRPPTPTTTTPDRPAS